MSAVLVTPDYIGVVIVDGAIVETVAGDDWAEVGILLREASKPFGDTAVTEVYVAYDLVEELKDPEPPSCSYCGQPLKCVDEQKFGIHRICLAVERADRRRDELKDEPL